MYVYIVRMTPSIYAAAEAVCCAHFGQGSSIPIHMNHVQCIGSESRLTDCPHYTDHNCSHSEDAGVQCVPAGELNYYAIRKY